jgi:hypothetical protein
MRLFGVGAVVAGMGIEKWSEKIKNQKAKGKRQKAKVKKQESELF